MEVSFSPAFLKVFEDLPDALQEEAFEKIELFKNPQFHKQLKVHKLSGPLNGRYSFSVNYKIRIVFTYLAVTPKEAVLLAIGDHDIYR